MWLRDYRINFTKLSNFIKLLQVTFKFLSLINTLILTHIKILLFQFEICDYCFIIIIYKLNITFVFNFKI